MRPDLNGLELLQMLKSDAALRDMPVLGVAARPRDPRAEEMKCVGLDLERDLAGYVTKPFSPFEILDAVEAALTKHGKSIPLHAAQLRAKYLGHQPAETDRACLPGAIDVEVMSQGWRFLFTCLTWP